MTTALDRTRRTLDQPPPDPIPGQLDLTRSDHVTDLPPRTPGRRRLLDLCPRCRTAPTPRLVIARQGAQQDTHTTPAHGHAAEEQRMSDARNTIENLWDRATPVGPILDAYRAKVLLEAAQTAEALRRYELGLSRGDSRKQSAENTGITRVADALRRLAAEAQQPTPAPAEETK